MAENNVRFNFTFKSSVQSRTSRSSKPEGDIEAIEKGYNYAVRDIAFKAARSQQRAVGNSLQAKVAGIVDGELTKMGRKIVSMGIGLGSQLNYPMGSLSIEGNKSVTLSKTDPRRLDPMSIRSVTGDWRKRTEPYLRRKAKKFGHRRWWLNKGELREALKNPATYTGAYGPVRVTWIPFKSENKFESIVRTSNLVQGRGRSSTVTVGRIEMSVLGRITPQMLNEPGVPAHNSKFTGLFDMMREDVEKKLLGRYNPRPLIEPFLTYYLNRQIPNRIWRMLEESLPRGSGPVSNLG